MIPIFIENEDIISKDPKYIYPCMVLTTCPDTVCDACILNRGNSIKNNYGYFISSVHSLEEVNEKINKVKDTVVLLLTFGE